MGPCGTLFHQQLPAQCLAEPLTLIIVKPETDSPPFSNVLPQPHYFYLSLRVSVDAGPGSWVKCQYLHKGLSGLQGCELSHLSPWITRKSFHGVAHALP